MYASFDIATTEHFGSQLRETFHDAYRSVVLRNVAWRKREDHELNNPTEPDQWQIVVVENGTETILAEADNFEALNELHTHYQNRVIARHTIQKVLVILAEYGLVLRLRENLNVSSD